MDHNMFYFGKFLLHAAVHTFRDLVCFKQRDFPLNPMISLISLYIPLVKVRKVNSPPTHKKHKIADAAI